MKINFTKKEYELLANMMDIADWVLHSHDVEQNPETKGYGDLRNKLLSHAEEMGLKGRYEKHDNGFYETREFEDNSPYRHFIDSYDSHTFWDQLIDRLTSRDQREKYGDEPVDLETQIERHTRIEHQYMDEFAQSGLDNLRLNSPKNSN